VCLCPFHGNKYTPSFSVSKSSGAYICFNSSCGVSGGLTDLVVVLTKRDEFAARRLIRTQEKDISTSYSDRLKAAVSSAPQEFTEFPQGTLDRLHQEYLSSSIAQDYMTGRGFEQETMEKFGIGYSAKTDMVTVPMHDSKARPIGLIGRSIQDKKFKNSPGLPTSKTLFNFHRAKKTGDTAIIVEASFDAMRIDQSGYPNVVGCLGGNFSSYHAEQLDRTFNTLIIMTDFDKKRIDANCRRCAKEGKKLCTGHNAGRDLGMYIANTLSRKRILWASYEDRMVYADGAKDPGDMTDDQIRQCLKNAVSNFEYRSWNLY